jgi:hypothetical protein
VFLLRNLGLRVLLGYRPRGAGGFVRYAIHAAIAFIAFHLLFAALAALR